MKCNKVDYFQYNIDHWTIGNIFADFLMFLFFLIHGYNPKNVFIVFIFFLFTTFLSIPGMFLDNKIYKKNYYKKINSKMIF